MNANQKGEAENNSIHLQNLEIGLEGEITRGGLLVQGHGVIKGREFYFHAKHSMWSFEMADDLGELPSDTRKSVVFKLESRRRFAGEMLPLEVKQIIESCAAFFAQQTHPYL